jgi:hypothetical protein
MSTQFNDQWILDRINAVRRQSMAPKGAWPVRGRRSHQGRSVMRLSTDAIRALDKSPKWVDRDT